MQPNQDFISNETAICYAVFREGISTTFNPIIRELTF